MLIYVIRHGQTDTNISRRINGLNDDDINAEGIKQCVNAIDEIDEIDADEIICSPLLRTRHTADIINVNNLPISYDERLIERDAGTLTGEPINSINLDDWWKIDTEEDFKNAETVRAMMGRIYEFLDEIKEKYKNKNILLVTHGGVMKIIETYVNGIPENRDLSGFVFKNCELREYEI